jgi:hypothetical protein
MIGTDQEIDVL